MFTSKWNCKICPKREEIKVDWWTKAPCLCLGFWAECKSGVTVVFPGSNNAHSVDSQEKAGLGSWVKISSQFPRKVSMIGDSRWQSACMPEEGHGWTEAPEASSRLAAAPQVPQCRCPTSPAANLNPPNHLLPYCSAPTILLCTDHTHMKPIWNHSVPKYHIPLSNPPRHPYPTLS